MAWAGTARRLPTGHRAFGRPSGVEALLRTATHGGGRSVPRSGGFIVNLLYIALVVLIIVVILVLLGVV